jgi:hypothetical protein
MKLIIGNGTDLQSLDSTSKVHRSFVPTVGNIQPQEPIHVQVRIRQYAEVLPELGRTPARNSNPGRLPVGMMLDCYL